MIMAEANKAEECITMGPWGGTRDGKPWSYLPANGDITQITIRHGYAIDSVLFQSANRHTGSVKSSNKFGGPGGDNITKVVVDTQVEQLKSIDMTIESGYKNQTVVTSITFRTNLASYGPIGRKSGHIVSNPMKGGFVVGFHGRAGKYLNSIGTYVVPKRLFFAQISGGNQMKKDENSLLGKFANDEDDMDGIRSITFYTNKIKYGPFGVEKDKNSMSSLTVGKMMGFLGASKCFISTIGVGVNTSFRNIGLGVHTTFRI